MPVCAEEVRALQLEALSDKLLRHLPREVWQELFIGSGRDAIRFEPRRLTLLHAESPLVGRLGKVETFREELAWLAECHLGELEPSEASTAVISFQEPRSALRLALGLQRMAADYRLRIGLVSGLCTVALFRAQGRDCAVTIGPELERAAAVAGAASAGSILVSPEADEPLQVGIDGEVAGCVLTEEFYDTDLAQASITPAPRASAEMSSFAGLGLV